MATEYYVQHVTDGIVSGPHRTRAMADRIADKFRADVPADDDADSFIEDLFPRGFNVAKSVDGYWDNNPDY